jgi:transposase
VHWQLQEMDERCSVIAPSPIQQRAGEMVKTDRLDALRLVRCFRADELVAILVPTKGQEGLRDLLRALQSVKRDQIRHMHQLVKFLIRQGGRRPPGVGLLSAKYLAWARAQHFRTGGGTQIITCSSSSTAPAACRS